MIEAKHISIHRQRLKYVVTDFVSTSLAFFVFNICRYFILYKVNEDLLLQFLSSTKLILEQIFIPLGLMFSYWLSGYYNNPVSKSRLGEFTTTLYTSLIDTLFIFLLMLINDAGPMRRRGYLIILTLGGILFVFVYTGRYLITRTTIRRLRNRVWTYSTLIIGNSVRSRETAQQLKESSSIYAHNVIGFIRIPGEPDVEDGLPVYDLDDISEVCKVQSIDSIIISPYRHDDKIVMMLLDRCFPLNVSVSIAPDTLSYLTSDIRLDDIMGLPLVSLTSPRLSEFEKNLKRSLDVLISAIALVILSPILAGLAVAVRLSSPGKIIYRQERLGRHQKPFNILKFRSMYEDAEHNGPQLSSERDPRITPLGKTMRKYRLDELPQFYNVLRGDMSLVGPRPEREYFVNRIVKKAPYYRLLFQVRPGITSWGMVQYGYAENVDQMVRRSAYDLVYLNNMSLSTDIKIIIYTIRTVVSGRGK